MLAAASPLLKSLLLESPETDTLYLDTTFDVVKKIIKYVYDVDPITCSGGTKSEALNNRKPFKEWLNLLEYLNTFWSLTGFDGVFHVEVRCIVFTAT